jgi:hypothetical protein
MSLIRNQKGGFSDGIFPSNVLEYGIIDPMFEDHNTCGIP